MPQQRKPVRAAHKQAFEVFLASFHNLPNEEQYRLIVELFQNPRSPLHPFEEYNAAAEWGMKESARNTAEAIGTSKELLAFAGKLLADKWKRYNKRKETAARRKTSILARLLELRRTYHGRGDWPKVHKLLKEEFGEDTPELQTLKNWEAAHKRTVPN